MSDAATTADAAAPKPPEGVDGSLVPRSIGEKPGAGQDHDRACDDHRR